MLFYYLDENSGGSIKAKAFNSEPLNYASKTGSTSYTLSRNLTIRLGFHHITCIWLWPSQSRSLFTRVRSYLRNNFARVSDISTNAKLGNRSEIVPAARQYANGGKEKY